MKLFTKNTDYAIRALLFLAQQENEIVPAKDISQRQGIPYEFLRKILKKLLEEDFIESKEGGGGGFKLVKSPAQIKILDVIKAFQGEIQLSECLFREDVCPNRATCVLRRHIQRVEKIVQKEFSGMTIAGLLDDARRRA